MMRKLKDLIAHQQPLTLSHDANVQDACVQMRDRKAGCVLVTDENQALVGIVTANDVVCRVVAEGKHPSEVQLCDAMTRDPVTMSPEKTAIDALRLMWECDVHHVPLTRAGEVVGVVARSDFKGAEYERLDGEREFWEHMR